MPSNSLLVKIFWLIVVFYLDPGGFTHKFLSPLEHNILKLIFLIISYCIFLYHHDPNVLSRPIKNIIKLYLVFISLWLVYFLVVFLDVTNSKDISEIIRYLIMSSGTLYSYYIVLPIIYFSTFSLQIFLKILVASTIVIGLAFIATIFTGVQFVDTWSATRQGVLTRNFMYGYGLINFVIPITISLFFLRIRINKWILVSFFVSVSIILVTVYRRDMIGFIEYVLIISIIITYLQNKSFYRFLHKIVNYKSVILFSLGIVMLILFANDFLLKSINLITGTLASFGIIESNDLASNTDNLRMSLTAKVGILDAIKGNFLTGTGYHPDWYTGGGGDNKWEGSDYILLSAFAMYGLFGLIVFLPFYIIYFRVVIKYLNFIKDTIKFYRMKVRGDFVMAIAVGIAASSELIKNLIEYPNWFYPIGAISDNPKYFLYFGLLLGSYNMIINNLKWNLNKNSYD